MHVIFLYAVCSQNTVHYLHKANDHDSLRINEIKHFPPTGRYKERPGGAHWRDKWRQGNPRLPNITMNYCTENSKHITAQNTNGISVAKSAHPVSRLWRYLHEDQFELSFNQFFSGAQRIYYRTTFVVLDLGPTINRQFVPGSDWEKSQRNHLPIFKRVTLPTWLYWRTWGATVCACSITCTGGAFVRRMQDSCWVMPLRPPTSLYPVPTCARTQPKAARRRLQIRFSPVSLRLLLRSDPLLLSCSETTALASQRSRAYLRERQTVWGANASYMEVCWNLNKIVINTNSYLYSMQWQLTSAFNRLLNWDMEI